MTERAPATPRAFAGRASVAPSRPVLHGGPMPAPSWWLRPAPPRLSSPRPRTLQLASTPEGVEIRVIPGY